MCHLLILEHAEQLCEGPGGQDTCSSSYYKNKIKIEIKNMSVWGQFIVYRVSFIHSLILY